MEQATRCNKIVNSKVFNWPYLDCSFAQTFFYVLHEHIFRLFFISHTSNRNNTFFFIKTNSSIFSHPSTCVCISLSFRGKGMGYNFSPISNQVPISTYTKPNKL